MRQRIIGKGYISGALALLLVLSSLYLSQAFAAGAVDISRSGTLTLTVASDSEFHKELSALPLTVKLYRVAEITENGSYVSANGYEDLKMQDLEAEDGEKWAKLWEEKALEAASMARKRNPDAQMTLENGTTPAEELSLGMYLIVADTAKSSEYEYQFTPYLISLPNNLYTSAGNSDWIYDVTSGLKPGREPLYGELTIRKTLVSYNASLKDATFVFQIEGVKDGENVYSNVVSTTHSAAGTKETVVKHIPAGAEVTVTEIYSGASYELVSDSSQTAAITAEGIEGESAVVDFINEYNEKLTQGYGVTNHFDYDEDNGWSWEQRQDNSIGQ